MLLWRVIRQTSREMTKLATNASEVRHLKSRRGLLRSSAEVLAPLAGLVRLREEGSERLVRVVVVVVVVVQPLVQPRVQLLAAPRRRR